ncbi:uncharacterized protein B0H18DRAFT_1121955 [Fomitopsis serialis]|uniref:uncharacterized protein n=1 Tax=Fomitopsis serialis TaxID=139415 RepID=UPI0020074DAE|nr:uncharacterized protein B0H18DRAFT_1121955 [Neoantrodia serialis]KAH9920357.1 hypothetical protein B0H18DRAFT_1121955 [Neoantrodia serialis]
MSDGPKYIVINFRFAVYASDASPTLPHEIIELIADFLWDEPVQLARCCLICCAWYHAAKRYLSRSVTIRSTRALGDLGHILVSKVNRPYGRSLRSLYIYENAEEPYAHTFSMRVSGCLLSKVEELCIFRLDWVTTRPHTSFFTYLNSFGTVTSLTLYQCCFRHAEVLRTIVDALPGLTDFALVSITVHSAPQALDSIGENLLPSAKRKLQSLQLSGCVSRDYASGTAHIESFHQSVLNVLAFYTNVNTLILDTTQFLSFSHFLQFFCAFPELHRIYCRKVPEWEPPSDEAVLNGVGKDMKAFTDVFLGEVSSAFAAVFFKLFAKRCCELRTFDIVLVDVPGPEFQAAIDKVLRHSGAVLRDFRCRYDQEQSQLGITPSLVYNTALERLDVTFTVASSLRTSWIYKTLLSLFTQLRSPCLEHMSICFSLREPGVDAGVNLDTDMETTSLDITIFHAAICHEIFSSLLPGRVLLQFTHRHPRSPSLGTSPFDAKPTPCELCTSIQSFVVPLFIPWLSRGVIQIHLPDGSLIVDPPCLDSGTPEVRSDNSPEFDRAVVRPALDSI